MLADFHTHSHYSDGMLSPKELMYHAKEIGLDIIALTDHDTIAGIKEAQEEALKLGIKFISGVELSTFDDENISMHVLGLNIKNLSEFSRHDIFQMRLTLRVKIGSETFDKVLSTHEIYESLHFTFANDKVINTFKDLKKYTLEIYFDENLVFVDEYSQKEKVLDDLPY